MSAAPERVMQPGEKRTLPFDYTLKLKTGDTVASINGGFPVAATGLTLGSPSLVGNVVSVQVSVSTGTPPNSYNVACRVTAMPSGDILELDCFVRLSDTDN